MEVCVTIWVGTHQLLAVVVDDVETPAGDDEEGVEVNPEVAGEGTIDCGVGGALEGCSVTDGAALTELTDVVKGETAESTSDGVELVIVELVIVDESEVELTLGVLITALGIDEGIVTSELAHCDDDDDDAESDESTIDEEVSDVDDSAADDSVLDGAGEAVVVSGIDEVNDDKIGVETELVVAESLACEGAVDEED